MKRSWFKIWNLPFNIIIAVTIKRIKQDKFQCLDKLQEVQKTTKSKNNKEILLKMEKKTLQCAWVQLR